MVHASREHTREIADGRRYGFGKNWQHFLRVVKEERIVEAERSLCSMLEYNNLQGKSFLDIVCGSGLFSLAAMRLGAKRIHSFDNDPDSVGCAAYLRARYFPRANNWSIEEASVLDKEYLASLGRFDIVYAWGVLHHTGNMWEALSNASTLVAAKGRFFVAIYNDQGSATRVWAEIKKLYNKGWVPRMLIISTVVPYFMLRAFGGDALKGKNPFSRYSKVFGRRGMSVVRDWFDWLGGYPFEVAKPEQIFDFCRQQGLELRRLKTCGGGLGNNQLVFERCVESLDF